LAPNDLMEQTMGALMGFTPARWLLGASIGVALLGSACQAPAAPATAVPPTSPAAPAPPTAAPTGAPVASAPAVAKPSPSAAASPAPSPAVAVPSPSPFAGARSAPETKPQPVGQVALDTTAETAFRQALTAAGGSLNGVDIGVLPLPSGSQVLVVVMDGSKGFADMEGDAFLTKFLKPLSDSPAIASARISRVTFEMRQPAANGTTTVMTFTMPLDTLKQLQGPNPNREILKTIGWSQVEEPAR
jgi:hypothetical protein